MKKKKDKIKIKKKVGKRKKKLLKISKKKYKDKFKLIKNKNMIPNKDLITIKNNENFIEKLLMELVLDVRIKAIKWSKITRQSPSIKIGYPGQHLASLITGIEGYGSAARGDDLKDGTEVKSCSRIDQLDKCNKCKSPVARVEEKCSNCGSDNIKRVNDSKWLIPIRNTDELETLLNKVPRVLLIISDYLDFSSGDFTTLRFQAFEIWPQHKRFKNFRDIMTNYYNNIYSKHKEKDANKNPAPKNFWPYQYQYYLCNPIQIFEAIIKNANTTPEIEITKFVKPDVDRSSLPSVLLPIDLITDEELETILTNSTYDELLECIDKDKIDEYKIKDERGLKELSNKNVRKLFKGLNENLRKHLKLREDFFSTAKTKYERRSMKKNDESETLFTENELE